MGKCYNTTVIDANIEAVWAMIKDFHEMSWADKIVTELTPVGDVPGTQVGAKRILNGVFHESLLSLDSENFSFSYSIDDGPEPVSKDSVSNYVGVVQFYPVTDSGQTFVKWVSSYEAKSDQAVADFCNPLYAGLLSALKSKF